MNANPNTPRAGSKITPERLARAAIVYIRQSSLHQVEENLESQDLHNTRWRSAPAAWAGAKNKSSPSTMIWARVVSPPPTAAASKTW